MRTVSSFTSLDELWEVPLSQFMSTPDRCRRLWTPEGGDACSGLAMSDPFMIKACTSKSSHQWSDTSHSHCCSLPWCYSAWPAPSCLHPCRFHWSHSLGFLFYGSSCRADCMSSNYSTTTRPVGCAFSSWFSLNASQFPGFTVRHKNTTVILPTKKRNKWVFITLLFTVSEDKFKYLIWWEMIIFSPRCKQILRQHWGNGWIQALSVVEGLLGCFHSAHCGRKCPDYQFSSLYSCKPVSLHAAHLRMFRFIMALLSASYMWSLSKSGYCTLKSADAQLKVFHAAEFTPCWAVDTILSSFCAGSLFV